MEENKLKKPIPYIWIDEESEHPMMMGEPCTILFTESCAAFKNTVQKMLGSGAGALLREVGKDMGKKYAKLTFKNYPELRELDVETQISELCSIILRNTGWGKIEFIDIDFDSNSSIFRLCGHPSSFKEHSEDEPVCHMEAGLISGILEVILGKKETAVNFSCESQGVCCTIGIKGD